MELIMKDIGERIKKARLAKGLKQSELAELVGAKSGNVVYSWEKATAKPDCERIAKICSVLNISPNELLGYNSEAVTSSELSTIKKYRVLDEHGKEAIDTLLDIEYRRVVSTSFATHKSRMLKLKSYVFPASAGVGNFLDNEEAEEIFVPETPEAEAADFIISVSGDSMEPTYKNGDKVLVCKQESLEVGEIGIFILNGDAYIKELGYKCLISHNKEYAPIPLREDDSIFCCGKVIGKI